MKKNKQSSSLFFFGGKVMVQYIFDGYTYVDNFSNEYPGYRKKGKYVPLHAYVYWLHTGQLAKKGKTCIHHIDGDQLNNSINNLELLSLGEHAKKHFDTGTITPPKMTSKLRRKISLQNRPGFLGFKGVYYSNRKSKPYLKVWKAKIQYNKISTNLGYFNDPLSGEIVYNLVWNEIYASIA